MHGSRKEDLASWDHVWWRGPYSVSGNGVVLLRVLYFEPQG